MVTALKVSVTPSFSSACNADAEIAASVKMNESIVAMSGAIMPAPLAMPLIVTVALPIFAVAVATLGNVSVVMIARAAARKSPDCARATRPSITPLEGLRLRAARRSRRSRRGTYRPACSQPPARRSAAVNLQASRPVLPVKALALPELTTSARALPVFQMRAAPFDRRRRALRLGEHAGHGGARIEQRQQHVGAAGVADAGFGGGEPHAGNCRHVRHSGRGERGD